MTLNKMTLKGAIQQAFEAQRIKTANPGAAVDDLSSQLADAIDVYIKTATVTVASGIAVSTAGSAATQTGATTAPGTGTIS